jgi:4-amino-4-deoxy-L-arabinose transferase-like glycosyltransferase
MDLSPSLPAPRPGLAILIIGAALAAGLATPWFLDYDEAVYADVARGMWMSGDWLRPASNCEPFYEKPILFYWLVCILYSVLGLTPAAPRLVSLLALVAALLFISREVARRASREAAEIAVWIAGASLLPFSLGRIGLLDALLTTAVTVALLAFFRGLGEEKDRNRRRVLAVGYAMTGLAMAIKGPAFPVIVAAVLLCDAVVQRQVRSTLRRSALPWGVPLVLAVGLPPYLLAATAAGPGFLREFFGEHNLGRMFTPMQGHGGSPLYYVGVLVVGLLPFSALVPWALVRIRGCDRRRRRLASFATVWGLVLLVAFSTAATKLPNYIAPAIPAFAVVVAVVVVGEKRQTGARWPVTAVLCVGFSIPVAVLPVLLGRAPLLLGREIFKRAPELAHLPEGLWPRFGFFAAGACLAGGSIAAWLLARRRSALAAVRSLGIGGAIAWCVLLISVGELLNATSILPVRNLATIAVGDLAPGIPVHVVEMNHRLTQNLATGRCTVFLRAGTAAERDLVRAVLARGFEARIIMSDAWWEELRPDVGGHETARDGAYVLVTGIKQGR